MKKLTIEDVAQKAGVSKSTVSQFLNKRYNYMSEATKKRIEDVIEELNYQPNALARSLKNNRTHMIGVIVANIDYTISIQCIRAIESELQTHGIQVIICNADENPKKESKYIEMLVARQVDGLIIFPTGNNAVAYTRLISENFPMVFLDRLVEQVTTHSLLLDNEMAVNIGIQELVHHHHQKIALITLPYETHRITPRLERLSGYKKAMEECNLKIRDEYIKSVPKEDIQTTMEKLLRMQDPPTAIVAGNDIVLAEMLKYASSHHIRIPDDISVMGIDDADFAHIYNPNITTIGQPTYDMGKQAARILLQCIEDKGTAVPIIYRFVPQLNKGKSVKTIGRDSK
ncbi:LacI family DNA-binding transcriptional regulator [Paenibacillus macquariensis]|uniref:Transcriptional regulator, LacI family n=1 Tax=Paenibacillus macquariensis TaxID=948756 RepID=A0ABY1JKT6_9BACL|nr:LacI family DNA-binding transcriptional regulator [Paenibacillus macquariensis]MEC0090006.1 LacI family DNA-binding transcriptional regulator [Paenibacillus macquariensis]OAB31109.1 LacI family transcriptional regulator [Paenibacillus macquariensis subsp. macquariensis]SIQ35982.1 transcriptional regulator, LacI family [Paenibacillus macquariensis]